MLGLLLMALSLLLLTTCSSRRDTLREIRERGILYIGMDPSYPPFEALAPDGELFGLDVDLGRELAGRLGVDVSFVLIGYDGLYDALAVGECDVLISALVVEPGRMDDVAYSASYFDAGLVLVFPARQDQASTPTVNMEDLAGRVVAVEYASEAEVEARRWSRRVRDLTVLPLTTPDDALAAVVSGDADTALVDGISAHLFLRRQPSLTLDPEPVTSDPFAVAVRADDGSLLRAINASIDAMTADGKLDAILASWLWR